MSKALAGTIVLDLTSYLPGPFAAQIFADLGATVIKIEARSGDPTRHLPPFKDGVSAYYGALNQGKQSLVLDLKSPAGVELLLRMVREAELLIESFRPGVLERLGLGPARLQEENPRLSIVSVTGFGKEGPYAKRPGHDGNYMAVAGALSMSCDGQGRPILPGLQLADMSGAIFAALGGLAGIMQARATGHGTIVGASLHGAALNLAAIYAATLQAGEKPEPGNMMLSGALPGYHLYQAKDQRWLVLCALEPKFFKTFCRLVEKPEWETQMLDSALIPELAAMFQERNAQDWLDLLEDEACLSPVLSLAEALDHPQAAGLVGDGRIHLPLHFEGQPPQANHHLAASAGADRDAILRDWLELDPATIESFREGGAFG